MRRNEIPSSTKCKTRSRGIAAPAAPMKFDSPREVQEAALTLCSEKREVRQAWGNDDDFTSGDLRDSSWGASSIHSSTLASMESSFGTRTSLPRCSYAYKHRSLKGEDNALAATELALPGNSGLNIQVFAVFDGHSGPKASMFCKMNFLEELMPRMPVTEMPPERHATRLKEYLQHLRNAVLDSFLALNRKVITEKLGAGCTASIVLVTGWIVTIANVGDSLVCVDTKLEGTKLISADHRLESNADEAQRLKKMGYHVARLAPTLGGPAREGEEGLGPLRIWPGGVNMARAIGDAIAGEGLLPYPHITQLKIPSSGARFILASDGVWDAKLCSIPWVGKALRSGPRNKAAATILQRATMPLSDDTTLLIMDVLPDGTEDYISVQETPFSRWLPCCFEPRPEEVQLLDQYMAEEQKLEILISLDTLPDEPFEPGYTFRPTQQLRHTTRLYSISTQTRNVPALIAPLLRVVSSGGSQWNSSLAVFKSAPMPLVDDEEGERQGRVVRSFLTETDLSKRVNAAGAEASTVAKDENKSNHFQRRRTEDIRPYTYAHIRRIIPLSSLPR